MYTVCEYKTASILTNAEGMVWNLAKKGLVLESIKVDSNTEKADFSPL
jgi:hypothetical protein